MFHIDFFWFYQLHSISTYDLLCVCVCINVKNEITKKLQKKRLHVARLVSCNIVSNLFFYIFGFGFGLRCQSKWEGGDKLGSSLLSGYH